MKKLNRASLVVFSFVAVFSALLFISPLLIPPNTVRGLDGRANAIDYSDLWGTMPPLVSQIYWFGDFNCHQKEERSIIINQNQMAVCSRDVGIFLGLALGALAMTRVKATFDIFETGLMALPSFLVKHIKKRFTTYNRMKYGVLSIAVLGLLPMLLDGFTQLLTEYESTNSIRLITGLSAGVVIGVGLCAMMESSMLSIDDFFPAETKQSEPGDSRLMGMDMVKKDK